MASIEAETTRVVLTSYPMGDSEYLGMHIQPPMDLDEISRAREADHILADPIKDELNDCTTITVKRYTISGKEFRDTAGKLGTLLCGLRGHNLKYDRTTSYQHQEPGKDPFVPPDGVIIGVDRIT